MNSIEIIESLSELLQNDLNIPLWHGLCQNDDEIYAVYVYMFDSINNSDNKQTVFMLNIQLSIYTKNNNYLELKESVMKLLMDNNFYVEDSGYTDIDTESKLYSFALYVKKEM